MNLKASCHFSTNYSPLTIMLWSFSPFFILLLALSTKKCRRGRTTTHIFIFYIWSKDISFNFCNPKRLDYAHQVHGQNKVYNPNTGNNNTGVRNPEKRDNLISWTKHLSLSLCRILPFRIDQEVDIRNVFMSNNVGFCYNLLSSPYVSLSPAVAVAKLYFELSVQCVSIPFDGSSLKMDALRPRP